MKKMFVVLAIAALMLMGTTAWAADKTIRFGWTQNLSVPIAGWHLYKGTTAGGENLTTPAATIPFTAQQANYTYDLVGVSFPDNQNTTFYWKMDAYTATGVKSVLSSEISTSLDLRQPSGAPGDFTATIQ